jgi:hypothetical protein
MEPLKIQLSSLGGVAHKQLLQTYTAYSESQFYTHLV